MRTIARYTVTNGLSGCYMPDGNTGPMEFATRKELASFIRDQLDYLEMPASLFREVKISKLWQFIRRYGSSCAHFHLVHNGYELAFHGLTEEEFNSTSEE